jgi:radical SAM enzyme (TIGR01210 family)
VIDRREAIHKVILSNNGSMLDEVTFSSTALIYLLAKLNLHLTNLNVVSIETRPEYVDLAELEFIARVLAEGDTMTHLEVAIGFEAFDEHIRNDLFQKGLALPIFERLAQNLASYGFRLKCYFMQKPVPDMTDEEAIADIHRAIEYLGRIAQEYKVVINMHLNATYVGAGTPLELALREGRYTPPRLRDLAAAARHARHQPISVFLGLYDEGLAVEGGAPVRPGEERLVAVLEEFNRTQDYDLLDALGTAQE